MKLHDPNALDIKKFLTACNFKKYGTTVDIEKRNQYIINYKGSSICHKRWAVDPDPVVRRTMGIHLLNKTSTISDINLLEYPEFVSYVHSLNDKTTKYEMKDGKECIVVIRSINLYKFLASKGFSQVILIDGSCESPFHISGNIKKRPQKNRDIIDDVKYLEANINFTSKEGNILTKLYDKKFRRTNEDYREQRATAIRAQNATKNKSRKNVFSVVNGPGKTR